MDFTELHNLLLINTVDVYTAYRAFLFEDKRADHTNMDELLKAAPVKTNVGVNFREDNGRKYSDDLKPVKDERDFTLYFCIHGDDEADFLNNYIGFINFLRNGLNNTGWLTMVVDGITGYSFKCFLKEPGKYEQITHMDDDLVASSFKVTFTEPEPNF